MKTVFIGKDRIWLNRISSTNSYLAGRLQKENLLEGTVVIAECQEQGRGQRGTSWNSETGKNLTVSVLLRPVFLQMYEQFGLSKAIALAVVDFVRNCTKEFSSEEIVTVKWPNDIYIGDKKVAGILIENLVAGNCVEASIVGIGININQEKFPRWIPNPVSLKLWTGKDFDLNDCIDQLCFFLENRYLQLGKSVKEINDAYLKNLYRYNSNGHYVFKGKNIVAKITGVTQAGRLILEHDNGGRIECDFKEIEFVV